MRNNGTFQIDFEKRYLRGLGMSIGIAAIVLAAISRGWAYVITWSIDTFGISRTIAARILENEGIQQLEQVLFSVLCFTVPFIIAARSANERPRDLVPFCKPERKTALPYLLFGISFCTFANFATNTAGSFFEYYGIDYNVERSPLPNGTVGVLLYIIATAVVPALVEEFACRGIVLGLLRPFGEGFAVIGSAVIFGVIHGNFEQIPFAFLVGLVLGVIRIKTGSMYICMAVHFINNLISVLLSYFNEGGAVSIEAVSTVYTVFMAASLLLGLIGVLIMADKGEINFKKPVCETDEKHKFIWFFTSPAIIIFIVLELLASVRYFVV